MKLMISEVQITCIVIMGLITMFLAIFLPRYTSAAGKEYNNARRLLECGTLFITLHFVVQYFLHKFGQNVADTRAILNILFGIPISYFVDLSYLYLQRDGQLKKQEWLFTPVSFVLAITVMLLSYVTKERWITQTGATYITAVLYFISLLYYSATIIIEFFRIIKNAQNRASRIPFVKWTKWSMFTLIVIGLGLPIMTFNTNLLMRSLYGIISISSAFFYLLSFIGYGLIHNEDEIKSYNWNSNSKRNNKNNTAAHPNEQKIERMTSIVNQFIESGYYLKTGITLKDVAVEMGISCNMLKMWIRTTEHEKFNNWISFLRIEKSKDFLIQYPDLNSEEIAEKCGFCDRQYFQHQFRKQEGISPSKWLKEQQMKQGMSSNNITGKGQE